MYLQLFKFTFINFLPLMLTSLSASISQKASVANIGLEGAIIFGAFFCSLATYYTNDPFLGLIIGLTLCSLFSYVYSFFISKLKANEIVIGSAFNLLAFSLSNFIVNTRFNNSIQVRKLPYVFNIPILSYVLISLPFLVSYLINKKKDNLDKLSLVFISNFLSHLAGAYISLNCLGEFNNSISSGVGFLALVVCELTNGSFYRINIFSFIFVLLESIKLFLMKEFNYFVYCLPYMFTILFFILKSFS